MKTPARDASGGLEVEVVAERLGGQSATAGENGQAEQASTEHQQRTRFRSAGYQPGFGEGHGPCFVTGCVDADCGDIGADWKVAREVEKIIRGKGGGADRKGKDVVSGDGVTEQRSAATAQAPVRASGGTGVTRHHIHKLEGVIGERTEANKTVQVARGHCSLRYGTADGNRGGWSAGVGSIHSGSAAHCRGVGGASVNRCGDNEIKRIADRVLAGMDVRVVVDVKVGGADGVRISAATCGASGASSRSHVKVCWVQKLGRSIPTEGQSQQQKA